VAQTWRLDQNFPNPFNATTTMHYVLPVMCERGLANSPMRTTLTIYNILGHEVRTLVDEDQGPGSYTVNWDGRDSEGHSVPSGVYFYRLVRGGTSMGSRGAFTDMKRMVLVK